MKRNAASGNQYGFLVLNGAAENVLQGNDGSDNADYGFAVTWGATHNLLTENRAYGNDGHWDAFQEAPNPDNTWERNCFGTYEGIDPQVCPS